MKQIILVGLGGGVGSILRYITSVITLKYYSSTFPLATFIVNIVGCLIIGVLVGLFDKNILSDDLKLLLITGFCGGYTTFSAFSLENILLLQSGHYLILITYIVASVLVSLFAIWIGLCLGRLI